MWGWRNHHSRPRATLCAAGLRRRPCQRQHAGHTRRPAFAALDNAAHVHKASFHVVKCAAFRLTPAAGDTSRAGIDGEEVQNGPVQAEAFKACLAVFAAEASPTGTDAA